MAKKPDTPCIRCGKLTWTGPRSLPAAERLCTTCRRLPVTAREPAEPAAPEPADGFGPRGARVWRDVTADPKLALSPAKRLLLEEVCRAADRLDRLDAFLAGREDMWLRFWRNDDGTVVRVVVDRALSEVRQQADTLRGLVADLDSALAVKASDQEPEASRSDELERRRAERQEEQRRKAAGL